jgi:hypothetical protein
MDNASKAKRNRARSLPPASGRACPFCPECDWARRDRYCWYDAVFLLLCMRPFRCLSCWSRFYVFNWEVRSDLQRGEEGQ